MLVNTNKEVTRFLQMFFFNPEWGFHWGGKSVILIKNKSYLKYQKKDENTFMHFNHKIVTWTLILTLICTGNFKIVKFYLRNILLFLWWVFWNGATFWTKTLKRSFFLEQFKVDEQFHESMIHFKYNRVSFTSSTRNIVDPHKEDNVLITIQLF